MSVSLPNQATANADSQATITALTTAAEAAFVASTTVLINQAIANGLFFVEPLVVPLVTPIYVTAYFQALGYTVLFPIIPTSPFNPAFVPGFPEVLPPGYQQPFAPTPPGPPRFRISWGQ